MTALTRLTVRSLGQSLMQSVLWANKEKIQNLVKDAATALDSESALKQVNEAIDACWKELNTADTETSARLSVLPPDFQQIVRAASILLEPSLTGRVPRVGTSSSGTKLRRNCRRPVRNLPPCELPTTLSPVKRMTRLKHLAARRTRAPGQLHASSRTTGGFCHCTLRV